MGRKKGSGKGRKQRHNEGAKTKKKGLAAKKASTTAEEPPKVKSVALGSGGDQEDSSCGEYGVVGLANLRNTCYLNSVLQVLMSSTKLQDHYGDSGSWVGKEVGRLEFGLRECFQAAKRRGSPKAPTKGEAFRPCNVLDAIRKVCPGFKGRHQHDAHELMNCLIQELLEEETKQLPRGKDAKDVFSSTAFSGEFGLSISCQNCGFVKAGKEVFYGISLPIVKGASHLTNEDGTGGNQTESVDSSVQIHSMGNEIVGPVIERNDPQCISNVLGESYRDFSNEPGLKSFVDVKMVVQGERVSLEIASIVHDNSDEDQTGLLKAYDVPNDSGNIRDPFQGDLPLSSSLADVDLEENVIPSPSGNLSRRLMAADSMDLYNSKVSHSSRENDEGEDGFVQVRKKKQKGRKGGSKMKEAENKVLQQTNMPLHATVVECLEEYFSSEAIHWKCPKEFPERRIQISDVEPEVFFVPRKDSSRFMIECQANGYSRMAPPQPSSDSSSEEEDECESFLEGQEARHILFPLPTSDGLKSCLKDPSTDAVKQGSGLDVLNSTKQYCIKKLPNVLLVHLKRFDMGSRGFATKLNQHIQFDRELDIGRFCDSKSISENTTRYSLRGVISHSGSLMGGHYVSYVLRCINDDQWFLVSDHDVQKVKESQVLSSQAYILVYELQDKGLQVRDVNKLSTSVPCEESESCVTSDEEEQANQDSEFLLSCQLTEDNAEANDEGPGDTVMGADYHGHDHQIAVKSPEYVAMHGEEQNILVHGQGRCSDKPVVGELCLDLLQEEYHAALTQV